MCFFQSSTSKPNYNEPEYEDEDSEAEDKPEIGAVVVESGNSGQMNGGLNWNNGGGMNWVRLNKHYFKESSVSESFHFGLPTHCPQLFNLHT